jgi:hypothetical protein
VGIEVAQVPAELAQNGDPIAPRAWAQVSHPRHPTFSYFSVDGLSWFELSGQELIQITQDLPGMLPAGTHTTGSQKGLQSRSQDTAKKRSSHTLLFSWPRHGYLPKSFEIRLGIDEGGVQIAVPQDIGNGLDGGVVGQGTNGPGMTKRSRATVGQFESAPCEMAVNDHGNGSTSQWPEWRLGTQKNFTEWAFAVTVRQVTNNSFAHGSNEWQEHFLSTLLGADA